jgi:triacylglycerol esterase/lipase EstA (alpha/beta hydrolase family)
MSGKTIVLAHGVLGFGTPMGLPLLLHYFNGVAMHLRRNGHTVIAPQVNPIGPVRQRGGMLGDATLSPKVAERIATLVTIGTPHLGSPVADAIAKPTDPLFNQIPPLLLWQLKENAGALDDLTTAGAKKLDEMTPDNPNGNAGEE